MRVLVIEDDVKVGEALRDGLVEERYDVVLEQTGEAGYFRGTTEAFDIILLDLGLPGRDGMEVLAAIRVKRAHVPVIILSARDTTSDRVSALDSGADDYLVKPFAFSELVARIRALCRRSGIVAAPKATFGSLTLDRVTRQVTRRGAPIALTVKEFDLLEYLMRCEGYPVSREAIARDVWQESGRSTSLDNVIDVHILRLRRKIDPNPEERILQTVRGVGFMLRAGDP